VERMHVFLKSPDAAKPWIRVGNKHVLPADASPPSIYALVMLAGAVFVVACFMVILQRTVGQ